MKKEFSDKQLLLISFIAIILSVFSIFLSMGGLEITGMATEQGYVNVTILTSAAITLHTVSINFSSAFVTETRNSYGAGNVSTREYGGTHMPCDADDHCGINITNDGNIFINVTILATEELFTSGGYDNTKYWLYNVTMQDLDYDTGYSNKNNCSTGYDAGLPGPDSSQGAVGLWRAVPSQAGGNSSEVAICYLNSTDDSPDGNPEHRPDVARVEFNITIPPYESGGDKAGTIQFIASDASA